MLRSKAERAAAPDTAHDAAEPANYMVTMQQLCHAGRADAPPGPCCGRPSTARAAAPSPCPHAPARAPLRQPLTACGPLLASIALRRAEEGVPRGREQVGRYVEGTAAPVGQPDCAAYAYQRSHLVRQAQSWREELEQPMAAAGSWRVALLDTRKSCARRSKAVGGSQIQFPGGARRPG